MKLNTQKTMSHDSAVSQVQSVLLLVAVVVLLVIVLLIYLLGYFPLKSGCECDAPSLIKISKIENARGSNGKYESVVVIRNDADYPFPNDDLRLELLINGEKKRDIFTLNGHNFIPTHHYGVQTIGGGGTQGTQLVPRSSIRIDFADNTIYPRERVTVLIYQKGKGDAFFMDSETFVDKKCRGDWVMQNVHGVHTRPICPISQHSMISP
jgi:FlaG/FlaF family flagellin (archaellin)